VRFLCLALLLAVSPAWASETIVRFSEAREVRRLPDQFYAVLRAEARAASAAAAQEAVNRAISAALARASGVAGVEVATGRYSAYRGGEPRTAPPWQAVQEITLRSADAASALTLVGAWQEQGLAVSQIGWRLTPALEQTMREEATRLVLAALEQRLTRVEIDGGDGPQPRPMAMAAAMARDAAPPVAVPEEIAVSVRATAEAILRRP
jgi:uncharacterized protein